MKFISNLKNRKISGKLGKYEKLGKQDLEETGNSENRYMFRTE